MKSRIGRALQCELRDVHVDDALKARILAQSAPGKRRREAPPWRMAVSIAAALVLMVGVCALVLSSRLVKPDLRRNTALTSGNGPVWMSESSAFYHAAADCSGMTDAVQVSKYQAAAQGKSPCPACVAGPSDAQVSGAPSPRPTAEAIGSREDTAADVPADQAVEEAVAELPEDAAAEIPADVPVDQAIETVGDAGNLSLSVRSYTGDAGSVLLLSCDYQYDFTLSERGWSAEGWSATAVEDPAEAVAELEGLLSPGEILQLETAYVENPGSGFVRSHIIPFGIEATEFHFVDVEDPRRTAVLYDMAAPYELAELQLNLFAGQSRWYFDGSAIQESESSMDCELEELGGGHFQLNMGMQTNDGGDLQVSLPVEDGGGVQVDYQTMEMNGGWAELYVLQFEDGLTAVMLLGTGDFLWENIDVYSGGTPLPADMRADRRYHVDFAGWIFEKALPEDACIHLPVSEDEIVFIPLEADYVESGLDGSVNGDIRDETWMALVDILLEAGGGSSGSMEELADVLLEMWGQTEDPSEMEGSMMEVLPAYGFSEDWIADTGLMEALMDCLLYGDGMELASAEA